MKVFILTLAIIYCDLGIIVNAEFIADEFNLSTFKIKSDPQDTEKVKLDLYYECRCPFSKDFYTTGFLDVVNKLGPYLDITTYPFGNAKIAMNDTFCYNITCQHGERECYGNQIHGCVIAIYNYNATKFAPFNACLMSDKRANGGSDNEAVDVCIKELNATELKNNLKDCAGSLFGKTFHLLMGVYSSAVTYRGVPHVRINGKPVEDLDTITEQLCKTFKKPPPPCQKVIIDQRDRSNYIAH